jgi:hypothetical protein
MSTIWRIRYYEMGYLDVPSSYPTLAFGGVLWGVHQNVSNADVRGRLHCLIAIRNITLSRRAKAYRRFTCPRDACVAGGLAIEAVSWARNIALLRMNDQPSLEYLSMLDARVHQPSLESLHAIIVAFSMRKSDCCVAVPCSANHRSGAMLYFVNRLLCKGLSFPLENAEYVCSIEDSLRVERINQQPKYLSSTHLFS